MPVFGQICMKRVNFTPDLSYTEEFAREMDSITTTPPAAEVKPDSAEFLVRLVSVKPMQPRPGTQVPGL